MEKDKQIKLIKEIREVNSGVLAIKASLLQQFISKIKNNFKNFRKTKNEYFKCECGKYCYRKYN